MEAMQRVAEKSKHLIGLISAKWGWVVTVATAFIFFTSFGTLYSFGILLVELQDEFGSGASETSWIGSIAIGLHALGTFFSSALVRRFDNRPVAIAGIFLCFGSVIVTSFMPILEVLYFTFGVVYGVGINLIIISSINLILRYFPAKNCSRATGLALTGSTVGSLVMNQCVHHLIAAWGWRNMLRVVGGIILIVSVPCVSTFSPPSSTNLVLADSVAPPEEDEEEKEEQQKDADEEKTLLQEEKQRLKEKEAEAVGDREDEAKPGRCDRLRNIAYPELWVMSIGIMGCSMTLTFYLVSMVSFLTTKGFEKSECTLFMMVLASSEVVGKILISAVADKLPFPKIYLFVMASLCGIGVMVMLLFAGSLGMMLGLAVVAGLLVMAVFDTLPFSICVEIFGSVKSLDTSSVVIIMNGVGLILGSLLGMSVDHSGNYDSAIFACIGIYGICAFLFIAVPMYQRLFAKERYVMVRNRRKALLMESDGPERTFDPSPLPSSKYIYLDIVSVV